MKSDSFLLLWAFLAIVLLRHELPQFTEYLGGLLVRLVVSGEGGQYITDRDMAFELSQRLLSDSVCVFLNRVEQLGRCSNLEVALSQTS